MVCLELRPGGAQQMSPEFAVDVSLLLSAAAHPEVQDLLDTNKLVRDVRRSAAQSPHLHSSMRLRGSNWFLVHRPMQAVVLD